MTTVLVVEDNADNLKLLCYALQRADYHVVSTDRGEEGIELARKHAPALILMDINLPGLDGLETTRRIRASAVGGNIPIIAITSYALAGDRERFLAAGCTGYLEKPIDPITLVDQLHRIIGREPTSP